MSDDENIDEILAMIDRLQLQIPEELQCPVCSEEHPLIDCQIFRRIPVSSRIAVISEEGICHICLRKHEGLCPLQICGVMGCQASHHPLLHSENLGAIPKVKSSNTTKQSRLDDSDVANIEKSKPKKRFACVPSEKPKRHLVQYPPQSETSRCVLGDGSKHKMSKCNVFRESNIINREIIVKQYELCIKCLASDHKVHQCRKDDRRCGFRGCQLNHHYLLHRIPFIAEEGLQEAQEAHDRAAAIHLFADSKDKKFRWCGLCKVLGHFPDTCTEWYKKPSKRLYQAQLERLCIHCLVYLSDDEHECRSQEVICGKKYCTETHHHLFHTDPKGRSPHLLEQSGNPEKWEPAHTLRTQNPDSITEYQLVTREVEGKPENCVIIREEDFMALAHGQGQPSITTLRSVMFPILKGTLEKLGAVYKGALYRKFCIDFVAKHGQDQIHVKQEDESNDTYVTRQALFAIRMEENRDERKATRK